MKSAPECSRLRHRYWYANDRLMPRGNFSYFSGAEWRQHREHANEIIMTCRLCTAPPSFSVLTLKCYTQLIHSPSYNPPSPGAHLIHSHFDHTVGCWGTFTGTRSRGSNRLLKSTAVDRLPAESVWHISPPTVRRAERGGGAAASSRKTWWRGSRKDERHWTGWTWHLASGVWWVAHFLVLDKKVSKHSEWPTSTGVNRGVNWQNLQCMCDVAAALQYTTSWFLMML